VEGRRMPFGLSLVSIFSRNKTGAT
jgi:hypothetical protein